MANQLTRHILLVEDDELLLELAATSLHADGHTVVAAPSAEEAAELLEAHGSIDCLVTDVVLPRASGLDLVARVARSRPAIPVLFMTGQTDPAVDDRLLATGHPVLRKPYTPDGLRSAVRGLPSGDPQEPADELGGEPT
jgi:CheY-like chemotaxis protein